MIKKTLQIVFYVIVAGVLLSVEMKMLVAFSVIGAGVGVWMSRHTARQQSTLEFINQYNNDDKVPLGHATLRRVIRRSPPEFLTEKERENILFLLNKFEILAIGLKHDIYDISMIKNTFGSDICGIYDDTKDIIAYRRDEDQKKNSATGDEAFEEFEKLAKKLMRKSGIKMWYRKCLCPIKNTPKNR